MIEPTIAISRGQIAFFRENGYLAIERITTDEEIETIRAAYDEIFKNRAGREEGNQFDLGGTNEEGKEAVLPQILEPMKYHPDLRNTLFEANAAAISQQLFGKDCKRSSSHAIYKPAGYGAETPWHQDEAYWDHKWGYNSLSVWMPLQEATVENGCMQFIPKSHRRKVLTHRHINNDPRIHGLEVDRRIELSRAIACPLPAGGATFHHSRMLHYCGPNRSKGPRRAFILVLETPRKLRDLAD